MRRHIRLDSLAHLETPEHSKYTSAQMDAARAVMAARGLRFDNVTGKLRDNEGPREEPANRSDFTPYTTEAEVMRWEFSRYIANSASRVERGFTP